MANLLDLQFPHLEKGDEDPVLQTLQGCDKSLPQEKYLPARQETQVPSLAGEEPLEKAMTTHSIVLAWKIPGMGEPGGLQSMQSHRGKHD